MVDEIIFSENFWFLFLVFPWRSSPRRHFRNVDGIIKVVFSHFCQSGNSRRLFCRNKEPYTVTSRIVVVRVNANIYYFSSFPFWRFTYGWTVIDKLHGYVSRLIVVKCLIQSASSSPSVRRFDEWQNTIRTSYVRIRTFSRRKIYIFDNAEHTTFEIPHL